MTTMSSIDRPRGKIQSTIGRVRGWVKSATVTAVQIATARQCRFIHLWNILCRLLDAGRTEAIGQIEGRPCSRLDRPDADILDALDNRQRATGKLNRAIRDEGPVDQVLVDVLPRLKFVGF